MVTIVIQQLQYKIFTQPIPVTTESDSNYVCAVLVDIADNESDKVCGGPYKLDKTISEPSIETSTQPNTNGWYQEDITVNITTETDLSTIKEIKYCTTTEENCVPTTPVDGASTTVTIDTESATNNVCALSIDQAGNESTAKCTGPYKLDKTDPELTIPADITILPSQVANYNLLTGASVSDTLSDIDGNITTSGELSALEKTYTITYTVKDKAGNSISKNRDVTVQSPLASDIVTDASNIRTNDPDNNPRYVGANPNNYVKFNNELWRIIGVFGGQIKIIRDTPLEPRTWGNTNAWEDSTLKEYLNTTYLDELNFVSKSYIETNHVWNLGTTAYSKNLFSRNSLYIAERSTLPSSQSKQVT